MEEKDAARDDGGSSFDEVLHKSRPAREQGLERKVGIAGVLAAVGLGEEQPLRVDRFEVIKKLGSGAMGRVYEARDPRLDRLVAIKVLKLEEQVDRQPELGPGDSRAMAIFASEGSIQDEARALARLNHPHVVAVYDVGDSDGQIFVAMEHMGGGSLSSWFFRRGEMDWRSLLRPFIEAGRGLAAAHAVGIVHRDFKTDNVLMTSDGVAKVADFGLARVVVEQQPGAPPPAYVAGTKAFMAPEVLRGESADAFSDQYSFCAALLAEFKYTGTRVPLQVRSLLSRGLSDDATERWPSLSPLLDSLERLVEHGLTDRHRTKLIDRVERSWIAGVLDASLGERASVSLPLQSLPDAVERPWDFDLLERTAQDFGLRTESLDEALELSNGSLLVLGAPGAGKTTALLELVRKTLGGARRDRDEVVPVVLNLSSYSRGQTLEEWVSSELVTKYRLPRNRVKAWLDDDELLLVLDGLDELAVKNRPACIQAINEFRNGCATPLVVACREAEYFAASEQLAFGDAVRVESLDGRAAVDWGLTQSHGDLKDERLRSPLWLSVVNAEGGPVEEGSWEEAFDHYVERALQSAPELSGSERQLFVDRLRWLAGNMARRGDSDLWLDRMQYSWLPGWGRQGLAMVLATLVTFVLCVLPSIFASVFVGRSALSGFVLGVASCALALAFNRGLVVQTGERIHWNWRTALRRFPKMVLLGAGIGLSYGLVMNRPLLAMLYLGTTGAAAVGILLGLDYADQSRGLNPYDGFRVSARQSVVIGLIAAGFMALSYGLLIAPTYGRLFPQMLDAYPGINVSLMLAAQLGTVVGVAFAFIYGGAAVLLHACYRVLLWLTTPLPLGLVSWLDEATARGLLRRVGGGYMFMHATLLTHLARKD
jgi:serine/threonine protein kinase